MSPMTWEELAEWLKTRDHQVTLSLRVEEQGLYLKMVDMKTGMIVMRLLSFSNSGNGRFDVFKEMIDQMYKELMDALGREEKNA